MFDTWDADRDGYLNDTEYRTNVTDVEMSMYDTDGDGRVSRAEYMAIGDSTTRFGTTISRRRKGVSIRASAPPSGLSTRPKRVSATRTPAGTTSARC